MSAGNSSHPAVADTESLPALSSTTPRGIRGFLRPGFADRRVFSYWCGLALVVVFGSLGLSKTLIYLWGIWTGDPLLSIGMFIFLASFILVLRVWRQNHWELRGTWWGLLPVALAFFLNAFRGNLSWYWFAGRLSFNLLPAALSVLLYAFGVVLFFGGTRVARQAWFPLALLLFSQPLPEIVARLVDLPLQSLAAHVARSFASLIGFPPTNPELLKLMFAPDFGMFIAPGCDGLRGAITMAYTALIAGYLKRVSIPRWFFYVSGALLLGYLFNLIRLCALVIYYRIAVGHPALEHVAKQFDYVVGGCLFLAAAALFLWVITRKEDHKGAVGINSMSQVAAGAEEPRLNYWKIGALAVLALIFAVPGVHAIRDHQEIEAVSGRIGELTSQQLDDLMPKKLGDYDLNRAWQQQLNNAIALECAAYKASGSNEITLCVWLLPTPHNVHDSLSVHGEVPEMRGSSSFLVAQGRTVSFDTAFYSDGITDTLAGNAFCTPSACLPSRTHNEDGLHIGFVDPVDVSRQGGRAVPILFQVETAHSDTPQETTYKVLSADAQRFLGGVDLNGISQKFQ